MCNDNVFAPPERGCCAYIAPARILRPLVMHGSSELNSNPEFALAVVYNAECSQQELQVSAQSTLDIWKPDQPNLAAHNG